MTNDEARKAAAEIADMVLSCSGVHIAAPLSRQGGSQIILAAQSEPSAVRPTAGGPVHRRYCGECGTRIDQRCPKCYLAAQPEPPASLREAVEKAAVECSNEKYNLYDCINIIAEYVEPVVEAREKLLREALDKRIDDDWLKRVRALIGGG